VQNILVRALQRAGARECGGVLMGEHVGHNHFAVRDLTVQRDGTFARFLRDLGTALAGLRRFFRRHGGDYRRFNYLGEWHSHPNFALAPSAMDHDSMRKLVTDPDVGANFLVLMVVKLDNNGSLMGTAHTYLPNGTTWKSELLLENQYAQDSA